MSAGRIKPGRLWSFVVRSHFWFSPTAPLGYDNRGLGRRAKGQVEIFAMSRGRNFVIYTRGRSGSTVIVDHLESHPSIVCYNELFSPNGRSIWENRAERSDRTALAPYDVFKDMRSQSAETGGREFYRPYLREMIDTARQDKPDACVGFKLLTYQANAHKRLMRVLKKQQFAFLHLIRRNVVRQVISSFVANERGAWNRRDWTPPSDRYNLDMTKFSKRVKHNQSATEKDRALLPVLGVDHLTIYYEDYVDAPQPFLDRIHEFLGVEKADVTPTDLSIMTDRNLRNVVANYDELKDATTALGLTHMLEAP